MFSINNFYHFQIISTVLFIILYYYSIIFYILKRFKEYLAENLNYFKGDLQVAIFASFKFIKGTDHFHKMPYYYLVLKDDTVSLFFQRTFT